MQSNLNLPQSPVSQFYQNPAFLSQIPGVYAVPPIYPSLGSSGIAHLLNNSPPSVGCPSTQSLVRSLTCPPDAMSSVQSSKDVSKAHATPTILKRICDTISGNLKHWNLALDFTPNKRGKIPCRKELAELTGSNEKMTLSERTLTGWLQSIVALGELAIAEEGKEASTGGPVESGNDSKPVDELKEACLALMKKYKEGVASGIFEKKAQAALRFPTPAELGPAPAPGITSPQPGGSSPQQAVSPAASGKNIRDAGIVVVTQRKRQNEASGGKEGAHRYPKKGGMGALNELAFNFGAYINRMAVKEDKLEGKENRKDNIDTLKELHALRAQAETEREKKAYTKQINKILDTMESDTD